MKKILSAAVLLILLLTGCSKSSNVGFKKAPSDFSAEVFIKQNGEQYKATLTRKDGATTVLYGPGPLESLKLTKSREGCSCEYLGIASRLSPESFEESSAISLIDTVLGDLMSRRDGFESLNRKDGILFVSSRVNEIRYNASFKESEMKLISISVPDNSLVVDFSY